MADMYLENATLQENTDQKYGEGASVFIGRALKAFYKGNISWADAYDVARSVMKCLR